MINRYYADPEAVMERVEEAAEAPPGDTEGESQGEQSGAGAEAEAGAGAGAGLD
jgi:hypothetical protein